MQTMIMNQDRNVVYPLNLFKLRARAHFVISPMSGKTLFMGYKLWMDCNNGMSVKTEGDGQKPRIEVDAIDLGDYDTEEETEAEIRRIRACVTRGEKLIKVSGFYGDD